MRLFRASGRVRWLIIIICLTFVQSGFAGFKKNSTIRGKMKLQHTDLKKIMASPRAYIGRKVTFLCRFGFASNFFKAFNTKYTRREYTNFSIWDDEVRLWDKDDRRTVLPSLYISVSKKPIIKELLKLRKYELTLISAEVTSSYGGIPWFDVTGIKSKDWEDTRPSDTGLLHIRNGVSLEKDKKHLLAVEHFKMALGSGLPDDYAGAVNISLGKSYYNAEEFAKAEKALLAAEGLDGKDSTVKLLLAEINLKSGKYQDAVKYCQEALSISAADPEIYAVMGECMGRNGDVDGGLRKCSLAINNPGISPQGKAMAQVHKARIYVSAKRYNEAVRAYAGAIGVTSPLASAAWLRKEIGRFYEDRYTSTADTALLKEAIREYKNAVTITKEKEVESLYLLANGYFKESQADNSNNFEKSKEIIKKINMIDSSDISTFVLFAKIAKIEGDADTAEGIYNSLIEKNPKNPDAYFAVAKVYESTGKKEQAVDAYKKVLEFNPGSTKALRKLAELNEGLGKLEDAKANYKRLIALDKTETFYNLKYAAICLVTGDYTTAVEQGRIAAATPSQSAEACKIASTALEAKGDLAGAENQLKSIMRSAQDDDVEVWARRAYLLAEMGKDLQVGLDLAESAVRVEPGNAKAKDSLGWVQYKLGKTEKSLKTLRGIAAANRDRSIWYHLGVVEHAANNYDDAIGALVNVIKPILATEIKAIAEKLKVAAEKLIPEIKSEKEEAQHQQKLKKKVEAMRKKEEERVLKEAMKKARIEASKEVETIFEEAKLPEKNVKIDNRVSEQADAVTIKGKTEKENVVSDLSEKISLIDSEEIDKSEELDADEKPESEIIEDKISFKAEFDKLEEEVALLYPEEFEGPEYDDGLQGKRQEFVLYKPTKQIGRKLNEAAADSMLAAMAGPELDSGKAEIITSDSSERGADSLKRPPSNEVVILPEWTF